MKDLPPLETLPITSDETLRKCRELPTNSNDIFICSFPKSGTTWMQNIVYQLLAASRRTEDNDDLPFRHISQYAPFYEIDAHWEENSDNLIPEIRKAQEALGYRIFNTHLHLHMLPFAPTSNSDAAKFIYVVRDGRDVLISYYHHMTNQHPDDGGFEGDFEEFFQQFLEGRVAYGKWSRHLVSWMPHTVENDGMTATTCDKPSILLVRYEDLKQGLATQVERIAEFLELPAFITTNKNDPKKRQDLMDQVLERVSFDWMRKNQELFHPISVRWKPGYNFIRSGIVGDHGSKFDENHQQQFYDTIYMDFGGRDEIPLWLHEFCLHSDK